MFEKRRDVICCLAGAEAGRIGLAAGPATGSQSTPSEVTGRVERSVHEQAPNDARPPGFDPSKIIPDYHSSQA